MNGFTGLFEPFIPPFTIKLPLFDKFDGANKTICYKILEMQMDFCDTST